MTVIQSDRQTVKASWFYGMSPGALGLGGLGIAAGGIGIGSLPGGTAVGAAAATGTAPWLIPAFGN